MAEEMTGRPPGGQGDGAVTLRFIGIVRSRFTEVVGMPIQAAGAPEAVSRAISENAISSS